MDEIKTTNKESKVREIGAEPPSVEVDSEKNDATGAVEDVRVPDDKTEVKGVQSKETYIDDEIVSPELLKMISKDTSPVKKRDVAATVTRTIFSFAWLLIVSLLVAAGVWSYVLSIDNHEYVKSFELPVTVTKENTDNGFKLYTSGDISAVVTVTGKRNEIYDITGETLSKYLELFADASDVTETGNATLDVRARSKGEDIEFDVKSIEPANISVFVDSEETKTVAIENKLTYFLNFPLYEQWSAEFSFDKTEVEITGPKSLLDNIEKAAVTSDIGSISESRNIDRLPITLVQKNGESLRSDYISSDISIVSGKVIVSTERRIQLVIVADTMPEGSEAVALPAEILLIGDPRVLDTVKDGLNADISEYIKDKEISDGTEIEIPITSIALPEGVSILDKTLNGIKITFLSGKYKETET